MKTKKIVIVVITATLLVSAMLIVGCVPQIDEITVNNEDVVNYRPPVGKGIVRFRIDDGNVRTILPDFDEFDTDGNKVAKMYFDILFTRISDEDDSNDSGDAGKHIYFPGDLDYDEDSGTRDPLKANYTAVTTPFAIPVGKYNYVITAYNNATGALPIAGDSKTGMVISSGSSTVVVNNIDLQLLTGSGNKGIFSYKITIPAGSYDIKKLEIFEYTAWKANANTASDLAGVTLNVNSSTPAVTDSSKELPIGYYIVRVTVGKDHYLTRQYTEVLHVYSGFTSKMDDLEVTELIENEFEVIFNMNGRTPSNASVFEDIFIGYGEKATSPGTPVETNYVFDGWFDGAGGSANAWNFNTLIVANGTTIYAHWHQHIVYPITVETPTLIEMGKPVFKVGDGLERDSLDGTNFITLELKGSWKNIKWSINSTIDNNSAFISANGNATLVITNGPPFTTLLATGITEFRVSVQAETDDTDSTPYSAFIDVPVTGTYTPGP